MDHHPIDPNTPVDVAVLGAGAMGLVAALTLRRSGMSVAVYERAPDLSASAAWRSGGMLAPDCEADGADASVVALGRRSMLLWPALADGVYLKGTLVVGPPRDLGPLARFRRVTANHAALGPADIARLEPDLGGRYQEGLFFSGEGHLDPRHTLQALVSALAAADVPVMFGWSGDADKLPAERIVDARGMGARQRFANLRGVKGEMVLVRSRDIVLSRPVRLLHHRHPLYVVPRADGVFMIGATTVESDDAAGVSLRSAGELLTQAYALHPAFADAEILEFNAGLRPAFPDNNPRIQVFGRTIAVNGLYRHGWLVAPALAADVRDLILTNRTESSDAHHSQR